MLQNPNLDLFLRNLETSPLHLLLHLLLWLGSSLHLLPTQSFLLLLLLWQQRAPGNRLFLRDANHQTSLHLLLPWTAFLLHLLLHLRTPQRLLQTSSLLLLPLLASAPSLLLLLHPLTPSHLLLHL